MHRNRVPSCETQNRGNLLGEFGLGMEKACVLLVEERRQWNEMAAG